MLLTVLKTTQIIWSIALIVLVLLQARSSGAGAAFGGTTAFATERRGAEKVLFRLTVITIILFVGNAVAILLI